MVELKEVGKTDDTKEMIGLNESCNEIQSFNHSSKFLLIFERMWDSFYQACEKESFHLYKSLFVQ